MQVTRLFLASSAELAEDRKDFRLYVARKNEELVRRGAFIEMVQWEYFLDAMSETRLQDEYNKAVQASDIFVLLFFTKVGIYTEEEFDAALAEFKSRNKPTIFTYFKDAQIWLGSANEDDLASMFAFKKKLRNLGHFCTVYRNVHELTSNFDAQLDRLEALIVPNQTATSSSPSDSSFSLEMGRLGDKLGGGPRKQRS